MAGGDTYTIIYLKMQLLSLKTDGVLTWTGLEENFADELALDLDEKPEDVEVTLMYLLKTGLAETKDNVSFFFPFVIENTGSEDASAQRVREFRKRQALLTGLEQTAPKTNAQRQKSFRAKQNCESKQHIPMIENDMNKKRYGGNYYLVCQRDGYKCAICGSIENLCVHHIDGFDERKPENNAENKMILLCRSCHSRVHAGTPIPQENLDRISYENSNVTCNAEVTQVKRECNVEKEIETDIEIERREREENNSTSTRAREDENDLSRVMNFFLDRINPMPSRICIDELTQFTKSLGADVVLHALNIAIDERKTAFSYIRGILSRYERDGIKTMDDVLRAEQEHAEKKENRPKPQRDEPVPAFTPPEKRHKPVNFSTDLVEWPPGSGNYFLKGEEPKDAHG